MTKLSISEIQLFPIKPKNGLIAFASCVINDSIYIGNIAIYTSPTSPAGYRLVYPQKILPNGKEINCVHPINKEAGRIISKAVIEKYNSLFSQEAGDISKMWRRCDDEQTETKTQ